ncbi:MAG: patatin family protein [Lachnospiraceae bacterium]|nr:patatin family protein [Lachnospiraceae bacterium]
MKTALVLEGGAMRGMYTAGVLDVFLEEGRTFDGVIGVSAGALFGVNFLSKQKGRVIRYNKKYNKDSNYMGIKPLLRTGNIVDTDYAYVKVPRELDPFDDEAYQRSKVPFYAVITNMKTGKPEYKLIDSVFDRMETLRASGSMPFVSKPVKLDGNLYLDGAITDSIPYEYMLQKGYDHVVVVLTKAAGYVKKAMPPFLTKLYYKKKYPEFERTVRERHIMYNGQMERLKELEKQGKATIIQPSEEISISRIEKDPKKLQALYDLGIKDAIAYCRK